MPPALERLLASPSALKTLRSIVKSSDLPSAFFETTTAKCRCTASRREISNARTPAPILKWRQWGKESRQTAANETTAQHNIHAEKLQEANWTDAKIGDGQEQDDAATWAQRLQHQERLYGLNGIRKVWAACAGFDLPTSDTPDSEFLWGTFVKVPDLVLPVIDHAAYLLKKSGLIYPHLYELCVGHWLLQRRHVREALDYHHQLVAILGTRKLPLRHLARLGKQRFTPTAYRALMEIYRDSSEQDLYDAVVPALCARGSMTTARSWHTLCVHRADLPSPEIASHPAVQALMAEDSSRVELEAHFVTIVPGSLRRGTPKLNEALMRRLKGRDIAPVRFDDSFCARMFATGAFPPATIIKGLAMVGVNEIGPQAVHTMASRTDQICDLPLRFEELRAAGVALQGCVFSLALEKFAQEKQWPLVRSMIESDQHTEVYDDAKLQKELLDYYIADQDWKQAHRTLAILSLFHNDPSTESWNLLLQAHIRLHEPSRIIRTVESMRDKEIFVSSENLVMLKSLLRPRQRGHLPRASTHGRFDDVRFVTRIYIMVLEAGIADVSPTYWREILRRYGMLGRFRELRRLVLRLLCWYAPRRGTQFDKLPKPTSLDAATARLRAAFPYPRPSHYFHFPPRESQSNALHPVRQLFPYPFQQALIVWGFRAGLAPSAPSEQSMLSGNAAKKHFRRRFRQTGILNRLDWSVGLQTLVQLRDSGLHVHPHNVTKALQMMFVNLFGRGRSQLVANRAMEAANTMPYAEYVREVNKIWGTPLFSVPQSHGKSGLHSLMWHPRFHRQVDRKTFVRPDESTDDYWQREDAHRRGNESHRSLAQEEGLSEGLSEGLPPNNTFHRYRHLNLEELEHASDTQDAARDVRQRRDASNVGALQQALHAQGRAMHPEFDDADHPRPSTVQSSEHHTRANSFRWVGSGDRSAESAAEDFTSPTSEGGSAMGELNRATAKRGNK